VTERFELLRQLGTGGMGTVWLARDNETGQTAALKLLHGHLANDQDYLRRFENEVRLSQAIHSPRVVQVYGYGARDGVPYLAMEYVPGESLKENIQNRGAFSWQDAKPVVRQIAEGLAAAHAVGIVHRDIKPSNILLTPQGDVKIADFGVSRALDATRLTRSSTLMGTPAYMAPESQKDERSDLYALGCVLFEMLTGRQPMDGDTPQDILLGHLNREPRLDLVADGQARRIAGWLLQKDPRRRPASAEALMAALDGTTRIPSDTLRTATRARKPAAVLLFAPVASLALLGGLAIGYALTRDDGGDASGSGGTDATAPVSPQTPTSTGGGGQRSATPIATKTPSPSSTPGATRTASATPTDGGGGGVSPTATRTSTVKPSATATGTATPTATATRTPTATATPSPTATATAAPTYTPTATPTVANYFLDITVDKYQFQQGENVLFCYDLTPNTPFDFSFYKSVNGGPKEFLLAFNDDGFGGCFEGVMGDEGFREYTFEARVNNILVAYRLAHAQVGPGNTTIMTVD